MKWIILILLLVSCAPGTRSYLKEADDYFDPLKNTDHNFTQGLRIGAEIPDASGSHEYYGQQLFYTPSNKKLSIPEENDRPYSGYLAGGYKAHYRNENVTTSFGVEAGLVGPHAYGEQIQNTFHKLIGVNEAKGWDYQLHDEPVLTLIAEKKILYYLNTYSDFTPVIGGNLGNLFTQGYVSGTLRVGYNLTNTYDSRAPLYPRIDRVTEVDLLSYYVFFTGLGKVVAYNMLLDGNTFRDSASVDKDVFVAEGRMGVSAEYDNFDVSYTYVITTPEFKGSDPFGFGEVSLGYVW